MLSLYGMWLIVAVGFAALLVLRAVGPHWYKQLFDKYLWTIGE
ncbi:hypothetical protein [Bacillus sp. AFS001701]|nr:hypothetical protein [Bacillus sp. AFS001701]